MTGTRAVGRLGASDCERVRDGWLAQPVNAVTSGAYCVAGWVVAARCTPSASDRRLEVLAFSKLLGLVGLGSIAYHGPQPPGSKVMHDWPIAGLLALAAATPLVRRRRGHAALPGWTAQRGRRMAVVSALAGAAYAAGRTGSPTCDPDSPIQLHGAWHVLSATGFVLAADVLYRTAEGG
jgi:hypothetical protein